MIINRTGASYEYEGVTFTIGQRIVGTEQSDYEGLYGFITEIRDGKDKETENDTPDIYCRFDSPVLPCDIAKLEEKFSSLYQQPKKLDDIDLEEVIMAAGMIKGVEETEEDCIVLSIYVVIQDWAVHGERGHDVEIYVKKDLAKYKLHRALKTEFEEGCLMRWQDNEDFCVESDEDFYEGYLDGEYDNQHYSIQIEERKLAVPGDFINLPNISQ